jgi:phospholipid/cholesterol/gamma-HCH transport system substrate-binding protein
MSLLDKKTAADATKLLIFMIITTITTAMLVLTIGNITFGGSREYQAEFSDATGVVKGDDIRIAGVKVGNVKKVEIVHRTRAKVYFKIDDDALVTDDTHATIKFRNLVGQRYISLTQDGDSSERLKEGSTIPVSKTTPALDLTVLFNGFKPLFRALSPQDINKLSYEIVQVFQGEGGTLEGLLGHTASLTTTLADRDAVIGDLIDNLNEVLVTVGDRDEQLSDPIVSLRSLVGGLAKDRDAILDPLESISALAVETSDLLSGIRPSLTQDIKNLRLLTGNIVRNRSELDRALQVLPIKLTKVGRTAIYGSWFNFYLCQFTGRVTVAGTPINIVPYNVNQKRCNLP